MTSFTVKFESGQGRGSGSIVYIEGNTSLSFPFLPGSNRLMLPNVALWHELLPPFVRERRNEVLPRVIEYCRQFSWLKLAEAQKKEELGCILLVEHEPLNIGYYGNPKNPYYDDPAEGEATFEKSLPII
jgi:hypothetical protein